MIYIKGINPTTDHKVYYRRMFNAKCVSFTETLEVDQTHFFNDLIIAQNLIIHLLNMKVAIANLEIVNLPLEEPPNATN